MSTKNLTGTLLILGPILILGAFIGWPVGEDTAEGELIALVKDPSFSKAIEISDSKNIDVIGIDMDEESFTESYTSNVSTWQLYKRGRLEKQMVKNGIEGTNPEEIVTNMENSIRKIDGFAKLEKDRVKSMHMNLISHLDKEKILAIIDVTNVEHLMQKLSKGSKILHKAVKSISSNTKENEKTKISLKKMVKGKDGSLIDEYLSNKED